MWCCGRGAIALRRRLFSHPSQFDSRACFDTPRAAEFRVPDQHPNLANHKSVAHVVKLSPATVPEARWGMRVSCRS